jgi:predicted dehydrogenase
MGLQMTRPMQAHATRLPSSAELTHAGKSSPDRCDSSLVDALRDVGETPVAEHTISRRRVLAGVGATTALFACSRSALDVGKPKLGVAVVGIGGLSLGQIIPGLRQTKRCHLAGLVSGKVEKLREVGAKNGVPRNAQFTYDEFDRIAENGDIDFVYIAVPNALHAEFAVRATRAGKHVFCEKPMAVSAEQCQTMISACKEAGRYLATAYRLQFEPHYQEMIRLAREAVFGPVRIIQAEIGFPIGDSGWRLERSLAGGGALIEMGIYAVQAACHLAGEEPSEVVGLSSTKDRGRFQDVEQSALWTMAFPSGVIAHCASSYSTGMDRLRVGAADGFFAMEPAYSYEGLRGTTSKGSMDAPQINQFAAEMDEFARCIQEQVPPTRGSAEEALHDVEIVSRIYASIAERRHLSMAPTRPNRAPWY